jgi:acetyl-CoA C-acetyltransferase
MPTDAFIYSTLRTPRGKGRDSGALHGIAPVNLLAGLLTTLQERTGLDTAQVDDLIMGCVTPIGEQGANIARTAALVAGWDTDLPGMQINRFCASGLEAVNLAAMKVRSGWEQLIVAGGVESMSRVSIGSDGGALMDDPGVAAQIGFVPQGISADLIATREGFTREVLDAYALLSQQRAVQAQLEARFASMAPLADDQGNMLLEHDEHMRPQTTLAALTALPPAFAALGEAGYDAVALGKYPALTSIEHVHTAGNSSGIVDGAAVVLVGSRAAGEALGLQPRARIRATAVVGDEPTIMLTGPAPATQRALQRAAMAIGDVDLIECNEAFAAVVLNFMRAAGVEDVDKVNVNGGAIALGHPLGATGAILLMTLLDELERRDLRTGLVTLCAGGGMGIATIIERV